MRALTATALLLALSAVALAKPNPVERPRLALVNADMGMGSVGAMHENIGSVGAMRERDYFKRRNRRSTLAFPMPIVRQDAPSPVVPLGTGHSPFSLGYTSRMGT